MRFLTLTLIFVARCSWAFPEEPSSRSECRPVEWISTQTGQQFRSQRDQIYSELRQLSSQCDQMQRQGQRGWGKCYDNVSARRKQVNSEMDRYVDQQTLIHRNNLYRCYELADNNVRIRNEHKNARSNQPIQQAGHIQTKELPFEGKQEDRAPRVISEIESSPYSQTVRNEPRVVNTPSYQAQQALAASQREIESKQEYSNALRGAVTGVIDGAFRGAASQNAALAEVQAAVTTNTSPVARALSSGTLATAGGRTAETINQIEQLKRDMDSLGGSVFNDGVSQLRRRTVMPKYASIQNIQEGNASESPHDVCKVQSGDYLKNCLIVQCKTEKFRKHKECAEFLESSTTQSNSSIEETQK